MLRLTDKIRSKPLLCIWLKYFGLFTMLFASLAMAALLNVISTESNPFFYANF